MALLKIISPYFPRFVPGPTVGKRENSLKKKLKFNPHLLRFPTAPLTKIPTNNSILQNAVREFSEVEKERNVEATNKKVWGPTHTLQILTRVQRYLRLSVPQSLHYPLFSLSK